MKIIIIHVVDVLMPFKKSITRFESQLHLVLLCTHLSEFLNVDTISKGLLRISPFKLIQIQHRY